VRLFDTPVAAEGYAYVEPELLAPRFPARRRPFGRQLDARGPLASEGARLVDSQRSSKAIIFVYLFGGPSHVDSYDMKPDAPAEYRGEFRPIRTNVPGFDICELMPLQATIADKLALVRNLAFNPSFHDPVELFCGLRGSVT
jgi:hypothetical protein